MQFVRFFTHFLALSRQFPIALITMYGNWSIALLVLGPFRAIQGLFGIRSGSVRDPFGIRSGPVRDPFEIHLGSVWNPFEIRVGSVRMASFV